MLSTSDVIVLVTLIAGTASAAVIDLRTRRVPNALTVSIAAAGLALSAAGIGRIGVAASLGGCLVGVLVMLPGYLWGGTGGGDVKLFGAVGTLLGPAGTVTAFVVTAVAGGALALAVAASRGRVAQTCGATARLIATGGGRAPEIEGAGAANRFAYAPAIAIGATLAAIGG